MPRRYRPPRRRLGRRNDPTSVLLVTDDDRGYLFLLAVRALWRHRSELAPVTTAAVLAVIGAWTHARHPGWALPLAMATVAVTAAVAVPPGRWPGGRWVAFHSEVLARPAERLYAAFVVAVAGGWLSGATAAGPASPPLPALAVVSTVAAGIPWWTHRRRRARVRVRNTIEAWPTFADSVGLPGSRIASAVVDRWGWTARLALRRGQTVRHAIDQTGAVESALGARPGAVRIQPDAHRADRAVLHVVEQDPLAQPVAWPDPRQHTDQASAPALSASVLDPVALGTFEDGSPAEVRLAYRNALVGGIVGSGKSGVLNVLLAGLVGCRDLAIWGIDMKGGMELGPWAACLGRLATTGEQASALLAEALAVRDQRAATATSRLWKPTPTDPALIVVIDEFAELPEPAKALADSLARVGRAIMVTLLVATQRPTQQTMGGGAARAQMDIRICLRVRERRDTDLILGQGMYAAGWHPDRLDAPGKLLLSDPEHSAARPARAYLITDQQIESTAEQHATRPTVARPEDVDPAGPGQPASQPPLSADRAEDPDALLWLVLCDAPDGVPVAELIEATGMSRATVYRRLHILAAAGQAVRLGDGRWRATGHHP